MPSLNDVTPLTLRNSLDDSESLTPRSYGSASGKQTTGHKGTSSVHHADQPTEQNRPSLSHFPRFSLRKAWQRQSDLFHATLSPAAPAGEEGSHWLWGSLILMNAMFGLGALTLPAVTQWAGGLRVALPVEVAIFISLYAGMLVVGWVCSARGLPTYESMLASHFPSRPWAERTVALIVFALLYVASIAYLVAIKGQFSTLVIANVSVSYAGRWFVDPRFLMFAISLLVIFPLVLLPQINHLKEASTLASLCVVYLAGVIIAMYFHPAKLLNPALEGRKLAGPANEAGGLTCALICVGSYLAAYTTHVIAPPVLHRTRGRDMRSFTKMTTLSMLACFVGYNIFVILPVLTVKDRLLYRDILLNLNPTRPVTVFAYASYILKLSLEYPVISFVGRQEIISLMPTSWQEDGSTLTRLKIGLGVLWYASTLCFALTVPEVLTAVQIVAVACGILALMIPGILLVRIVSREHLSLVNTMNGYRRLKIGLGWAMILIGALGTAITLYISVMGYVWHAMGIDNPCLQIKAKT